MQKKTKCHSILYLNLNKTKKENIKYKIIHHCQRNTPGTWWSLNNSSKRSKEVHPSKRERGSTRGHKEDNTQKALPANPIGGSNWGCGLAYRTRVITKNTKHTHTHSPLYIYKYICIKVMRRLGTQVDTVRK